jgi:general secretion pathway protein A
LKRFLSGLAPQQCEAIYCHLTQLPAAGMLKLVVTQLGEVPRRGKDRLYEQILDRAARAEGTLLLVFDEAHLLDGDALTDLRLLISSALEVGPPLKMLLVGQEPLRAMLRRARHTDLANRVSVRHQLRPLSKDQTVRYIDFQMTSAGGDANVFGDEVKVAIHDFTGGVPRQINNLATACLLQATARKVLRIDDHLFQQAVGEFQLP